MLQVTEISETTWRTGWKSLVFKAFGETYSLHLHPSHLLAPQVQKGSIQSKVTSYSISGDCGEAQGGGMGRRFEQDKE